MTDSLDEKVEQRNDAATAYYAGNPIMTDDAFDALTKELEALGVEEIVGHGYSPDDKVKIQHGIPMLSLAKVHSVSDVESWYAKSIEDHDDLDLRLLLQPKYDGLALSLTYNKKGRLVSGATRGNGYVGEDVTHTVKVLAELDLIPGSVLAGGQTIYVRGEVVITETAWEALQADESVERAYSGIRQAASGILRRTDTSLAKYLTFIAYEANVPEPQEFLQDHGFANVYEHQVVATDLDSFENLIEHFRVEVNPSTGVETDGVVIKFEDADLRDALGMSTNSPRWAVAYKFPTSTKTTTFTGVEWSTGRTGRIIPTLLWEPVLLQSGMVDRATGSNMALLKENKLRIGDIIEVTCFNEIIPGLVSRVKNNKGERVVIPDSCPNCEGTVHVDGRDLVCDLGRDCNAVAETVYALKALGLLGIGYNMVSKLFHQDGSRFKDLLDLITVTPEEIEALDGFTIKSGRKFAPMLQGLGEQPLRSWIVAMSLPRIGWSSAAALEEIYPSLDALAKADRETLETLPRFGEAKVQIILDAADKIQRWSDGLAEFGWFPAPEVVEEIETTESEFTGKAVCVTGVLPSLKRNDVHAWLISRGAEIHSSVKSTTDILIAGEKAGSKMAKAESLGITIIDGATFEANNDV